MNHKLIKLVLILTLLFLPLQMVEARQVINFNHDWKFTKGNPANAQLASFDDAGWQKIHLPHDWAIFGPVDSLGDGETGKLPWRDEAWYRKTFRLNPQDAGKRVYFLFDGIMARPKIYINGQLAGQWDYGYNSFYLDVSDRVDFKKENVIAVHVDTRKHGSRWYPGAGIYRKVQLIVTDPVHVAIWGSWVSTPDVRETWADVRVVTTVNNFG